MAESSRHDPANSNTITQQEYEDMNAPHQPSGVIGVYGDTAIVYADGTARAVKVRANKRAKVRGRTWYNDAAEVQLAIAANASGSTRIDTIVLQLSRSTWQVRLAVVQGTPGAGAPALTQQTASGATVWELPLTDVTVVSGATVINAGNVATREWYLGSDGALVIASTTTRPTGFAPGQRLWVADINKMRILNDEGGWAWAPGTIVARSAPRTANVQVADGNEKITDSVTFEGVPGQTYTLRFTGSWQASAASENSEIRIRTAAGAAVTSTDTLRRGTLLTSSAGGINVPVALAVDEVAPALDGQSRATVGAFLLRTFGPGTHTSVGGVSYPADVVVIAN